jgi:hypothetical protein
MIATIGMTEPVRVNRIVTPERRYFGMIGAQFVRPDMTQS